MIGLVGLMKLELPTRTVRLCDGGFIAFDGDIYRGADEVFGAFGGLDPVSEGVGDEVPAFQVTFLPAEGAEPADLTQPGFQRSRCRFWVGEYDPATGVLTGVPDALFDGMLDRTQLTVGRGRSLAVSIVSLAERLFALNIGNGLTDRWHQSVWPGELGHANATGLMTRDGWGAAVT